MKQKSSKPKKSAHSLKSSQLFAVFAVVFSVVAVVAAYAVHAGSANAASDKLTICHATNSDGNPYSEQTSNGKLSDGPLWTSGMKDQKVKWGDIIPPTAAYPYGQNWTSQGQAIYNNGCNIPSGIDIAATQPAIVPPMCLNQFYVFTFVAPDHYHYEVGGQALASGQQFPANGSTVTVVAVPDSGYIFSGTSSWDYIMAPAPC